MTNIGSVWSMKPHKYLRRTETERKGLALVLFAVWLVRPGKSERREEARGDGGEKFSEFFSSSWSFGSMERNGSAATSTLFLDRIGEVTVTMDPGGFSWKLIGTVSWCWIRTSVASNLDGSPGHSFLNFPYLLALMESVKKHFSSIYLKEPVGSL